MDAACFDFFFVGPGLMRGERGGRFFFLDLAASSLLCLSLSQNYHTSSNCPLRTAAAILSRRSATPPLSGPAEACGEGATGGDGSGIISFDGWLSESLVLFFFFPFSALREAESRDRERERGEDQAAARKRFVIFTSECWRSLSLSRLSLATIERGKGKKGRERESGKQKKG